jgi:hypothetical protein
VAFEIKPFPCAGMASGIISPRWRLGFAMQESYAEGIAINSIAEKYKLKASNHMHYWHKHLLAIISGRKSSCS